MRAKSLNERRVELTKTAALEAMRAWVSAKEQGGEVLMARARMSIAGEEFVRAERELVAERLKATQAEAAAQ